VKLSKAEEEAKKKLGPWGLLAEKHWREHRPNMVRELEKRGILYRSLLRAEKNAENMCIQLTNELPKKGVPSGLAAAMARSQALREYILLPSEEDVPKLGERPER